MAKRLVSVLGDSISTFEGCNPEGFQVFYEGERCATTGVRAPGDTWWAQVIDALDSELLANGSYSGSMVEGAGFPAGNSAERIAALARGGQQPDVVLVFMGINDYGWGGADAQAAGRGNAVPECLDLAAIEPREPGLADVDAAARFGAAYEHMLGRLRAAYSQAEVWCCTLCPGRVVGSERSTFAYNLRGVPFDRYNDAIRSAAAHTGCLVADVAALGYDYEGLEGTHPTARGMRQFAALVLCAMANAGEQQVDPAAAEAALVATEAPRSQRTCEAPCVGCPDAGATNSHWLCVCNRPSLPS